MWRSGHGELARRPLGHAHAHGERSRSRPRVTRQTAHGTRRTATLALDSCNTIVIQARRGSRRRKCGLGRRSTAARGIGAVQTTCVVARFPATSGRYARSAAPVRGDVADRDPGRAGALTLPPRAGLHTSSRRARSSGGGALVGPCLCRGRPAWGRAGLVCGDRASLPRGSGPGRAFEGPSRARRLSNVAAAPIRAGPCGPARVLRLRGACLTTRAPSMALPPAGLQ